MVEHTPGPWAVHPFRAQVDCSKSSRLGGLLPIAQMLWPTDERSEEETAANARLIAAAPDLLEAVLFLRDQLDELINRHYGGELPCNEEEAAGFAQADAAIARTKSLTSTEEG